MKILLITITLFFLYSCRNHAIQTYTDAYQSEDVSLPEVSPDLDLSEATVSIRSSDKEDLQLLLQDLSSFSLVSDSIYNLILQKIQHNEIHTPLIVLNHIPQTFTACDTNLSFPPPTHYLPILDSLAKRFNLKLQERNVKFIELFDEVEKKSFKDVFLSAKINEKYYSDTLSYFDGPQGLIDPSFYKILNDGLAEENRLNRIYMIRGIHQYDLEDERYTSPDPSCQVFLLLSQEQSMLLRKWEDVLNISYEEHSIFYSRNVIRKILKDLNSAGFEDNHVKEDSLADFRTIEEILSLYKPIVAKFSKDENYVKIFDQLKEKSGGKFNPQGLTINSDGKLTTISFNHGKKKYTMTLLNFEKDIPELIKVVNTALNEKAVNGNFYLLDLPGSVYQYIFLTEEKVAFLNSYTIPEQDGSK